MGSFCPERAKRGAVFCQVGDRPLFFPRLGRVWERKTWRYTRYNGVVVPRYAQKGHQGGSDVARSDLYTVHYLPSIPDDAYPGSPSGGAEGFVGGLLVCFGGGEQTSPSPSLPSLPLSRLFHCIVTASVLEFSMHAIIPADGGRPGPLPLFSYCCCYSRRRWRLRRSQRGGGRCGSATTCTDGAENAASFVNMFADPPAARN